MECISCRIDPFSPALHVRYAKEKKEIKKIRSQKGGVIVFFESDWIYVIIGPV